MYSFKEKKRHFNALLNSDAAKYDLELLLQKQPNLPIIATYSRNPKRYANDILYLLLDYSTREEIREFRRSKMNSETKEVDSSTIAATLAASTINDGKMSPTQTEAGVDSFKTEEHEQSMATSDSVNDASQSREEELQEQLEEAIERAEEAEANNEEAEEAIAEAEARAEAAEAALEEEKKKEKSQAPVKSKSKKSTRKSTGTTSSTRKSK